MEDQSLEGSSGGMGEKFAPLLEGIKKFGIGKLLLIIIILSAALWFFVLAPKPADLTVKVVEIDSGKPLENVEVDLRLPDGKIKSDFTGPSGRVTFEKAPSAVQLEITATPGRAYEDGSDVATLKSGEPSDVTLTLSKRADLDITPEKQGIQLGAGCTTSLPVLVKNNDKQAIDVELVGDGKLGALIQSTAVSMASGTEQKITVEVAAPAKKGEKASGKIRAKYTNQGADFSIAATEPDDMKVSPSGYDGREAPNTQVKQLFTITNDGREGEIRDLAASLTGDAATFEGIETTFADDQPIKPGEEKILTLSFTTPSADGKYVGVLLIKSACKNFQIPIELQVEAPRQ